jgi:hypothetical protein
MMRAVDLGCGPACSGAQQQPEPERPEQQELAASLDVLVEQAVASRASNNVPVIVAMTITRSRNPYCEVSMDSRPKAPQLPQSLL